MTLLVLGTGDAWLCLGTKYVRLSGSIAILFWAR
jgi:hypothetical protein